MLDEESIDINLESVHSETSSTSTTTTSDIDDTYANISTSMDNTYRTVNFKVIGYTKEEIYQDILRKCRDLIYNGQNILVMLSPEPRNPYNSRAIAFTCLVDSKWYKIGFIVNEIVDDVHKRMKLSLVLFIGLNISQIGVDLVLVSLHQ